MPSDPRQLTLVYRGPVLRWVDRNGRIDEINLAWLDCPGAFLRAVARTCPLTWVIA
jgi:hypothetical protein